MQALTGLFQLMFCFQWRSKGGKWGHALWSASLEGATAHFLESL